MNLSGIALIGFIVLSIVHLAAEAVCYRTGRYLTKPFLLPVLVLYYAASAGKPNYLLIAALGCGWLGDIFLMIPDARKTYRYFRPGLAAFSLGHIFYMAVFAAYFSQISSVPAWGWMILAVYMAVGIAVCRFIATHAGKMFPAVIAYIIITVLMGSSTVFPLGSVNKAGAVTVMMGAFVFMLSDSVNAYNRFVRKIPLEWLFIMGFYLAGQFLLVQGYLMF